MRGVILTQIFYTIHTHKREIKEKEEDKEIKYYQTTSGYCVRKNMSKYHFSNWIWSNRWRGILACQEFLGYLKITMNGFGENCGIL
jgi:hypothetical protein